MADFPEIRTERLILRAWRPDDLPAFSALNADPEVMRFLPKLLTREESDARVEAICQHFQRHGFGLWAVEAPGIASLIGFTGLSVPTFEAPFMPCVEIGWRLARRAWGHGYATEAARAALQFGFQELGLKSIVSYTVPENVRSWRVMERLGMTHDPANDFEHPLLPVGHPLRRHLLYRLESPQSNLAEFSR
jgi:RimJ/RimL family protein N-acetyltransferase